MNIYTPEELAERWRVSPVTVRRALMAGKTEFTVSDAILLRDTHFPEMSVEYLFTQTQ